MAIFREDRDVKGSIRDMAAELTDHPHVLGEAKTKKGPHRPDAGTEYDEYEPDDKECRDKCDPNAPCCQKDKPEDGKDPEVCPGDGPDLGKKPAQDKPKKFKEHTKNLKKKEKPSKETDNRTEKDGLHYPKTKKMTLGDSLEQAVDKVFSEEGFDYGGPYNFHSVLGGLIGRLNEVGVLGFIDPQQFEIAKDLHRSNADEQQIREFLRPILHKLAMANVGWEEVDDGMFLLDGAGQDELQQAPPTNTSLDVPPDFYKSRPQSHDGAIFGYD